MRKKDKAERQADFFDTCSHCKTAWSCCHETTPPITDKRRNTIEAFLSAQGMQVQNLFAKQDYVFPKLGADGYCVFHDRKTRKCKIHSVKPETCVAGPVTFDINKTTGTIEWFLKKESLCPLAGRVFQKKTMLNKHLESAKKELNRLVHELDPQALIAILKRDEPETFKIDEDPAQSRVLRQLNASRK